MSGGLIGKVASLVKGKGKKKPNKRIRKVKMKAKKVKKEVKRKKRVAKSIAESEAESLRNRMENTEYDEWVMGGARNAQETIMAIKKKKTKKKISKKTRVERNKKKKRDDWEHDLAAEEFAYKNPGQRIPSKKALIGKKPPTKRSKDDIPF